MIRLSALVAITCACAIISCNQQQGTASSNPKKLDALLHTYFMERMSLFPLEATANGYNQFNDRLNIDFTDGFRDSLRKFFSRYRDSINVYDRAELTPNDQLSYDIFKYEMETALKGLAFHTNYYPFNQFDGLPLAFGLLGSGDGNQPFRTVADYDNWLKRASIFPSWADSAIIYFKKGVDSGMVLPQALVKKMIPQMRAMEVASANESLFYGPIKKLPSSVSEDDKKRLTASFDQMITQQVIPAYKRLADFFEKEYLPKARTTSGIGSLPNGDKIYNFYIQYWTTTQKTGEEIFGIGLAEVKRIALEMERVKKETGFKGNMKEFFEYMKTDKKFMPFKTPAEVLAAFKAIQTKIEPNLKKMFGRFPKTPFEIRQTEAFRAASASAEYMQGSPDGSRPGIFYVPILDATKFNTTSGMESLFLHEAIPGHHFQISLQQENDSLPEFRRFSFYSAYGEGWALYCESLGKELGLYTDPFQYMGALGDEMHRAVRLVVDVGLHQKKWTREQAISYMMENEPISEQGATAEIERYMALPAQALSYKIGGLKIAELRHKFEQELGSAFSLAAFDDYFLKDGSMPLDILENKMNAWAAAQQEMRK
jgi:uncharacterized protein (DUF885 family)